MTYQNLLIEDQDGILLVTLNRPKALNALNKQTMQELNHLFGTDIPERAGLKGIILTGAGDKAFVAGADIKEFTGLDQGAARDMAQFGHDTFNMIEACSKPVIAVIGGYALGGGCELAMACHLRIAEEHARFGQPEVNLGLLPGYGGTQRLVQYIGKTKAMELLLTADMIKADAAKNLGLVNDVTPKGEGVDAARKIIEKISTKGPVAVAKTIAAVNAYFATGVDGFAYEVEAFGACANTEDFKEGAAAFVEKRAAAFQGK